MFQEDAESLTYNAEKLLRVTRQVRVGLLKQMHKTVADNKAFVSAIQQWCSQQAHFPKHELADEVIEGLLLNKHFSVEKAKVTYENYLIARRTMPEFVCSRDPCSDRVIEAFRSNRIVVLPQVTPSQHRVTIIKPLYGPKWSFASSFKACLMIAEYRVRNDAVMGEQFVYDVGDSPLAALTSCPPDVIIKAVTYLTSCISTKLKGVHFVNPPSYVLPLVNVIKRALKPKLAERVQIHKSYEHLFEVLPRRIFPKDLGGEEDSTCDEISAEWLRTLQSSAWRRWFIEQDSIQIDETKRIEKINKFDERFGAEGYFRKIDID